MRMNDWKEYNLTEVCDTISDTYRDSAEKVVLINTSDVLEGNVTNHELVPNKNLAGQFKKKFQKDDILYSEIRPANRRYAYVDFEPKDYIASTKLMVLRSKPCILPKYLYYLLTNNSTIRTLHAIAVGRSGTFPQITFSELANIKFQLPSLEEQEEILSTLLYFDNKIAINRSICENLEAQAQALFKHWFIDFAPFKDGRFVESDLGMIPEELIFKRIEEIPHTLETGRRPAGGVKGINSGVPSIGAENIKGLGCYDFSKTKYISKEYAASMKKGKINGYELLIYKDGGKPGYFIPNFAIFGEGYPYDEMCLNEHVFKLDFGNKGYSLFAYFFFKTKPIMSYLNAQGAKAAIPGINSKDIDAIMMPSLENECVKNYCNKVEDIITQILVLSKESARLSTLRDTLLPRLMSGELKI